MGLWDGGGRSLEKSELIVNVYCNIKNLTAHIVNYHTVQFSFLLLTFNWYKIQTTSIILPPPPILKSPEFRKQGIFPRFFTEERPQRRSGFMLSWQWWWWWRQASSVQLTQAVFSWWWWTNWWVCANIQNDNTEIIVRPGGRRATHRFIVRRIDHGKMDLDTRHALRYDIVSIIVSYCTVLWCMVVLGFGFFFVSYRTLVHGGFVFYVFLCFFIHTISDFHVLRMDHTKTYDGYACPIWANYALWGC